MTGNEWPIFVISLSDSVDRRDNILRQFHEVGININFIDAIDGRKGLPSIYDDKIDRDGAFSILGRNMSDGEFACALSHRMAYEKVINSNLPGAIILEDDAIISDEFAEFMAERLYLRYEFVQFDYDRAFCWKKSIEKASSRIKIGSLWKDTYLATGYSLSRDAAAYIIQSSSPIKGVADWPCALSPLEPAVTIPRLVRQPDPNNDEDHSLLKSDRDLLMLNMDKKINRASRFFKRSYWKTWFVKRFLVTRIG